MVRACDEILAGQHHDMFPLHVWMTDSGGEYVERSLMLVTAISQ
jgi:fumarate hydratase class II